MLAAHRCGGRTDFRSFARAWDRFTGAGKRARSATEREVRTLTAQLEASIWAEDERRAETLRIDIPPAAGAPAPPGRAPGSARSGAGTATATRSRARCARSAAKTHASKATRARPRQRGVSQQVTQFAVRSWQEILRTANCRLRTQLGAAGRCSSAGLIIITSGTMQAGESRSRHRTTSATSSGWIISRRRHLSPDPLGHRRVDEPGADRGAAHAVAGELLGGRLGERDHAPPWSPSRRPAIPAGACPRSRRC